MNEFKPCPFCGEKEHIKYISDVKVAEIWDNFDYVSGEGYMVICDAGESGCGADSGYGKSKKEALIKWNRRVT